VDSIQVLLCPTSKNLFPFESVCCTYTINLEGKFNIIIWISVLWHSICSTSVFKASKCHIMNYLHFCKKCSPLRNQLILYKMLILNCFKDNFTDQLFSPLMVLGRQKCIQLSHWYLNVVLLRLKLLLKS
jgi:hypothetical protein